MDFFARQDQARRNTKWLAVYFILGVIAMILAIYVLSSMIFFGAAARMHNADLVSLWNPRLFAAVTLGTLAIIGIGSATKTMELSRGGVAVADMMNASLVNSNTRDPDERKLLNVVEEMALASGVPAPPVYVMKGEIGINAFAAGHTTSDAVVCVTEGCMKLLTRDELQGVIGHEFSHILNGDMRLNVRLMGAIFGILCLALVGRILLQCRGSSRGKQNPLPLLGLLLLVAGWMGVFFGRLIQSAVSRQREFLADASSVQFTRNPAGITGALKKIGGFTMGSELIATHAHEASHFFFADGVAKSFMGLFETHPPLTARIRVFDPAFDGKFPVVHAPAAEVQARLDPLPVPSSLDELIPPIIGAASVLPQWGETTPQHIQYAAHLRKAFPAPVQNAARDPFGASVLIYGLLLSDDEAVRAKQLDFLSQNCSTGIRQEAEKLAPDLATVAVRAKLPLVDLALPALSHLSPAQYEEFSKAVQGLIAGDGQVDLFEYVLQKTVLRHLDAQFKAPRKTPIQYYALGALGRECSVLLSALAYAGASDTAAIQTAFQQGAAGLARVAAPPLALLPPAQCDLAQVDDALNRLAQAVPQIKKNVLNACAHTVAADRVIQETEAELLRAVAESLDCPLPPFVQPPEED